MSLANSDIEKYLLGIDASARDFKDNLFRLSWYMRGGVSVNDLLYLYGHEEREMITKLVKENIELTEKTRMPLI